MTAAIALAFTSLVVVIADLALRLRDTRQDLRRAGR